MINLANIKRLLKNDIFWTNLLIVIIFLFYLVTIVDDHNWGGDFSMYILNAKNIASGLPYAQTGYIYNPDVSYYGPPAYPPVFPLMLSPFILVWGVQLQLLKLPVIFCFIGALFFLNNRFLNKEMSLVVKITSLITIGICPYFFFFSENILSDLPFLFLCYLALHSINLQNDGAKTNKEKFGMAILTGLLIYLAYGTRSVGLALLPVALLADFFHHKKITLYFIVTLFSSLVFIFLQYLLIPQTGSYLDQFNFSLHGLLAGILDTISDYLTLLGHIFPFKNQTLVNSCLLLLSVSFVVGVINRFKKKITSFEIFFFVYLGVLCLWPAFQGERFLIPVIPLFFLYAIEGFEKITLLFKWIWLRKSLSILLLAFVISLYGSIYLKSFPRTNYDIKKPATQELFRFVSNETSKDDVILFFKPRVLALFVERQSVAMAIPASDGDTLGRMKELGVDYVILRKNYPYEIQPELNEFLMGNASNFKLIYENSEFNVYRVISYISSNDSEIS